MKKQTRLILFIFVGFFLLLSDQLLKYLARTSADFTYYIWQPWLGWEYLANPGVAFGIPVPNFIILLVTPLIIFWLAHMLATKKQISNKFFLGTLLILTGAISNFIDRVIFDFTIDYFRVITSVINIADISIVIGALLLITPKKSKTK